jgi:hypothetical protein
MNSNQFGQLMAFLRKLEEAHIHYQLTRNRDEAVSIHIAVPGERWEVDFLDDGGVDVERFVSDGRIDDETALSELFAKFSDVEPATSHDSPP